MKKQPVGFLRYNKGFTLVELMVVISLLSIVFSAIFLFFNHSQKVYMSTEAQSRLQDDVNKFMNSLGADIRRAHKPNDELNAVEIAANRQELTIYSVEGSNYKKICYKLNPVAETEFGEIQKGWVEGTSSVIGNNVDNWETVLKGVRYKKGSDELAIFNDITDADDEPSDRRVIQTKLTIKYEGSREVEKLAVFTSRSKG